MYIPMQKKLLIVEDEVPLLKILMDSFYGPNLQVIGATSGKEALNLALRERPDLILLDLMIPKMDGFAVLERLRQDPWGKNAAVLILTNLEGRADKTLQALEHGVFEFLIKTRWSLSSIKKLVYGKLFPKVN